MSRSSRSCRCYIASSSGPSKGLMNQTRRRSGPSCIGAVGWVAIAPATRSGLQGGYRSPAELLTDLRTVQESLLAAGAGRLARGELQHLIWQAQTFGFHLASLEIRQHSSIHRQVIAELLPGLQDDAA